MYSKLRGGVLAVVAVAIVAASGCGSDGQSRAEVDQAVSGPDQQANLGDSGTFSTTLTEDRPAARDVELAPGEALRVWARPVGTPSPETLDSYSNDYQVSLAIAAPATLRATLEQADGAAGYDTEYDSGDNSGGGEFYSDYPGFSYDSYSSPLVDELGLPLVRTSWYYDPSLSLTTGVPPWFSYWGHGFGEVSGATGTWMTFVAPTAGTYRVLIAGFPGPVEGQISTQKTDVGEEHSSDEFDQASTALDAVFPYRGTRWIDVVEGHVDFLTDGGFFPDFVVDDPGGYTSHGPTFDYGPTSDEARSNLQTTLRCGRDERDLVFAYDTGAVSCD